MSYGSVTPGGTETTVIETDQTDDGFLECVVDLANLASGDTVVLKVYRKTDGTNYRLLDSVTYTDAQTYPEFYTGRVWCNSRLDVKVTIQQTAGTNRAFPWEARVSA